MAALKKLFLLNLPGLWDHYKMTSHGPPSLETTIPNPVDVKPASPTLSSQTDASSFSTESMKSDLSSVEMSTFVIPPNVDFVDEVSVKNDNILSRQQPVKKIQPFQVTVKVHLHERF